MRGIFKKVKKKLAKKPVENNEGEFPADSPPGSPQQRQFHIHVEPTLEIKDSYTKEEVVNCKLPPIQTIRNETARREIFTQKLRLCCVVFDFTLASSLEMEGIEKKRQLLGEIVDYISSSTWYTNDALHELIRMVSANIFRTLPINDKRNARGDLITEEEQFQDPAWPHLHLIYELALRFLISSDADKKLMQELLQDRFVVSLIKLFESEDMRERDYLKTILHRIYGRFMQLRIAIRRHISNICYDFIYSNSRTENGIAEFLDIFCSIIHGFSIPVKEEHKTFLRNVLIPLHKCDKLEKFYPQLVDCCVTFVTKEPGVGPVILGGLLKFWPVMMPSKQVFFLREMLSVVSTMVEHENGFRYDDYIPIMTKVIDKIVECMRSTHYQVSDQAISLWSDPAMFTLAECDRETIWRKLYPVFRENQYHWNQAIAHLSDEVAFYFSERDPGLWKTLEQTFDPETRTRQLESARNSRDLRKRNWSALRSLCEKESRAPGLDEPQDEVKEPIAPTVVENNHLDLSENGGIPAEEATDKETTSLNDRDRTISQQSASSSTSPHSSLEEAGQTVSSSAS